MIEMDIARMHYQSIQPERLSGNVNNAQNVHKAQDAKLRKACQDFEAIFIKQMLTSMKNTIDRSGLSDGGFAEEIYDDMLYDEYANKMAKTAGFGISDMLYRQLTSTIYK